MSKTLSQRAFDIVLKRNRISIKELNDYLSVNVTFGYHNLAKFPEIFSEPGLARGILRALKSVKSEEAIPVSKREIRGYINSLKYFSGLPSKEASKAAREREKTFYVIMLQSIRATGARTTLASYGCAG